MSMIWPTQAEVKKFFGEAGNPDCTAGMADLAYPMRVAWDKGTVIKRFRCHKKVEGSFERIFQRTLAHYGHEKIKELGLDLFGGCYNYRAMRGGTNWSMHAYGIAVDVDPEKNQLKWTSAKASLAKPACIPFWEIVESEGAVSLGRLKNYDWMHFQFARL